MKQEKHSTSSFHCLSYNEVKTGHGISICTLTEHFCLFRQKGCFSPFTNIITVHATLIFKHLHFLILKIKISNNVAIFCSQKVYYLLYHHEHYFQSTCTARNLCGYTASWHLQILKNSFHQLFPAVHTTTWPSLLNLTYARTDHARMFTSNITRELFVTWLNYL